MDKIAVIRRMRERNIKWSDIAYCMEINEAAAQMALKRANDIIELGEKPVVKKSKFETPVLLKVKELARDNPKLSVRDIEGELNKIFPGKLIPKKTTIHKMLKRTQHHKLISIIHRKSSKITTDIAIKMGTH